MGRKAPRCYPRAGSRDNFLISLIDEVIKGRGAGYPPLPETTASRCRVEERERPGVPHLGCGYGSTPIHIYLQPVCDNQLEQRRRHGQGRSYPHVDCRQ